MDGTPATRTAYDDPATVEEMSADGRAVAQRLTPTRWQRAARKAMGPAPSLRYEDQPRDRPKPEVRIDDATARLASALHLHLD